jgi:hypothetical protein
MSESQSHSSQTQSASPAEGTSRREMLKSLGRYGALLGLLGGVGAMAARSACGSTPCSACPALSGCDLSKARASRDVAAAGKGRS